MFVLFVLMVKTVPRDISNLRPTEQIDYKFISQSESSSTNLMDQTNSKIEVVFKKRA